MYSNDSNDIALKELDALSDLLDAFENSGLHVIDLKKRIEREKLNRQTSLVLPESPVLKASIKHLKHHIQKELLYIMQEKIQETFSPEDSFSIKIKGLLERIQQGEDTTYKGEAMRDFLKEYIKRAISTNSPPLIDNQGVQTKSTPLKRKKKFILLESSPGDNNAPPLTTSLDTLSTIMEKAPKLTLDLNAYSNDTSLTRNYTLLQDYQKHIDTHIQTINKAIHHYDLLRKREKTPEELKEYLHFIESESYRYKSIPEIINLLNNKIETAIHEIQEIINKSIPLEKNLNKRIDELKNQSPPPSFIEQLIHPIMKPLNVFLNSESDTVSRQHLSLFKINHNDNRLHEQIQKYKILKKDNSGIRQLALPLPNHALSNLIPLNQLVHKKEELCRLFEQKMQDFNTTYYDLESERIHKKKEQTATVILALTQINEEIRQEKERVLTLFATRNKAIDSIQQSIDKMVQLKQTIPTSLPNHSIKEWITKWENLMIDIQTMPLEQIEQCLNLLDKEYQEITETIQKRIQEKAQNDFMDYVTQVNDLALDHHEYEIMAPLRTERTRLNINNINNVSDYINKVNTTLKEISNQRKAESSALSLYTDHEDSTYHHELKRITKAYIKLEINTGAFKEQIKTAIETEITRLRTEIKPDNLLITILRKLLMGIQNYREKKNQKTGTCRPHFFLPSTKEKEAAKKITELQNITKSLS